MGRPVRLLLSRRFLFGLAITAGLLAVLLWKVDLRETGRVLRDANYAYYVPAVLVYFVALGFRSLRWHYLLSNLKSIPARRLYPVVAIGYMANNVLPFRLGELVRAHYLGEREGVSKASGLATILVERIFDGLTLLFLAAIIWPFLPLTDVLRNDGGGLDTLWLVLSILVAAVFLVGFVVVFLLATSPTLGGALARLAASFDDAVTWTVSHWRTPAPVRLKVEELVRLLIAGLSSLRSPRRLLLIAALSLPVWLVEAAMYYIIAISLDLDLSFQVILLVTATSNLATAVPSSVGGIGPFEVVAAATLVGFGVGLDLAAAYAFFVHIVALWLPVNALGLAFLARESQSLGQLTRRARTDMTPVPEARAAMGTKDPSPDAGRGPASG